MQLAIIILQVSIINAVAFAVFDKPCKGSLPAAIVNSFISGIAGMMFGNFSIKFYNKAILEINFLF